ncbi:DedA family protein [Photobacterium phosphoreum]|jgi:membrane protein DedA with SNARE-associated domain|uniref:DedA family protein n=1 Tax=Photobacterium phosphoreum TaxID=659 RepID=UPI0005D2EA77|nr:DedA family protein [Photobacterium phosphoreum]KJF88720.1 membrane protein [Photobacterium phosphoreum]MCD9461600.1 DedA family protein [Photobacterium phosphoreum]MCD9469708.1 DedA family protein [Photobacterium phosphoreum]MCD9473607.1 DedA family protein [Photobacterium phosphoreum]MCD9478642.1 DedA family protein [Photobacterium phosphoreum]
MLDSFVSIFSALWHQDFAALQNPESIVMIYFCVTFVIWLESAFLPAAPLPCDSIVILAGTLGAMGIIDFKLIVLLLIIASAIGSWLAYLQGRWLDHLPKVKRWVDMVPPQRMQTVDKLLIRHGIVALFAARFIPVVRPLLPLMMGFRIKNQAHFFRFAWLSATAWILLLTGLGYLLTLLPENIARITTMILMVAPFITLAIAIISLFSSWLLKRIKKNNIA